MDFVGAFLRLWSAINTWYNASRPANPRRHESETAARRKVIAVPHESSLTSLNNPVPTTTCSTWSKPFQTLRIPSTPTQAAIRSGPGRTPRDFGIDSFAIGLTNTVGSDWLQVLIQS